MIDWSIDWLIDWLTGWLTDRLLDWLIDWLFASLNESALYCLLFGYNFFASIDPTEYYFMASMLCQINITNDEDDEH